MCKTVTVPDPAVKLDLMAGTPGAQRMPLLRGQVTNFRQHATCQTCSKRTFFSSK